MNIDHINWYPGHMKKTRELIRENLKMVDLVIEVADARIPAASRNPIIDELIQNKDKIVVLNKIDLADSDFNKMWIRYFQQQNHPALGMNCVTGDGSKVLMKMLYELRDKKNEGQIRKKPLRMMVVGIPNVGKSSLINRLTRAKGAKTGNKPGVTRGKQWLNMGENMQLLDTPGILWPKFEDKEVGRKLAYTGAIKDEILDIPSLALELIGILSEGYPKMLMDRYKLDKIYGEPLATMEAIARKRGFIMKGDEADYDRTARTVMDEFRAGIIGKITLESVPEDNR